MATNQDFKKIENDFYISLYGKPKKGNPNELWDKIKQNQELLKWSIQVDGKKTDVDTINGITIGKHILLNHKEINPSIYEELIKLVFRNKEIARISVEGQFSYLYISLSNSDRKLTTEEKNFAEKEAINYELVHGFEGAYNIRYYILKNPNWSILEKRNLLYKFWNMEEYSRVLNKWQCDVVNHFYDCFDQDTRPFYENDEIMSMSYNDLLRLLPVEEIIIKKIYDEIEFCNTMMKLRTPCWKSYNTRLENATKYFPEYITIHQTILPTTKRQDIEDKYNEYCREYFLRNSEKDIQKKQEINSGYQFFGVFYNQDYYFNNKSSIIDSLENYYRLLLKTITEYNFNIKENQVLSKITKGANQNRVNKDILNELEELNSFIYVVFNALKTHAKSIISINDMTYFDYRLFNKLDEKMKQELFWQAYSMNESSKAYRDTYNQAFIIPRDDNNEAIGLSARKKLNLFKENWRKTRNESVQFIKLFAIELKEIYDLLPAEDKIISSNVVEKMYIDSMNTLIKSPNAYCYLNKKEKEDLESNQKVKS